MFVVFWMVRVVVVTLGFDEKFAIRGLLRVGLGFGDCVLVFTARPVDERVERALGVLREFISRYYDGVKFRVVDVDVQDFYGAVLSVGSVLKEEVLKEENGEVIFNFSGGMRSLILETLVAAVALGIDGMVEVELENFAGVISFPLRVIKLSSPLKEEYRVILRTLLEVGEMNLSDLARRLGVAKSTIHSRVKHLINLNLIKAEYRGKSLICTATEMAKLFI